MMSARVWWDSPTATDKENGNITSKVTRSSGPDWGSSVSEGLHKVQYRVKDARGAAAYCSFYVNVTVVRCSRLSVPSHGDLNCSLGSLHGSECWLSCQEGFKASGAVTVRCEKDGGWSPAGVPTCEELTCPPPPLTVNGWYDCAEQRRYQSTCRLQCSAGFVPRGPVAIECLSNLTWSGSGSCRDDTRPVFMGCPSDMRVIAEPGETSFQLNWTRPSVTDNSESVNLTLESHSPGSWFGEGTTGVVYRAEDAEKNVATCAFIVTVVVLKCGPPDFDKSNMDLMDIHGCTHGYIRGSTCDVSCRSGFPHLGAKSITCVADVYSEPPSASWRPSDTSDKQPECKVYPCPALRRPDNGALVCDNWSLGRMCSMVCHQNFDVPRRMANGAMYACGMSTGRWLPNNLVPDCNRARQPDSYRLPGTVYYYSGDCPSDETELQIKQQFIQIMLGHPVFSSECQNSSACRVEDVSVYCGSVTRSAATRHRSATDRDLDAAETTTAPLMEISVEFVMTLPFTSDFEVKGEAVMNSFSKNATSSTFDLDLDTNVTLEAKDVSMGHSDPQCPLGSIFNVDSSNCAGCELGTYYSAAADDCLKCPAGSYGDEGFLLACKSCPHNTSTAQDGATSATACTPECEAGHVSLTGLAPCSPCPLASFQPRPAQQSCLPCPANFSTASPASTSNSSCLILTACDKGPCGAHPCNNVLGGFECSCQGGWNGPRCELPPDPCHVTPCHNNATCVSEGLDFSCACSEGFFGDLCQYAVVDGGWGTWDSWSPCSVSCGGGERSRTRLCDDPPPGPRGQPCHGSASVEEICNDLPCPVCEELEQPEGVEVNCSEEADSTQSCTVSCPLGLVFAEQPASPYQCGPATNFTWTHKLNDSNVRVPVCSPVTAPSTLNLTTSTRYIPCDVIQENESSVVISMTSGMAGLACVAMGLCRPRVTLGGCSQVRGKRSLQNVTLEVTLTASMEEEELDFVQFFQNNTMTLAVKRYVDSLVALVTSGEQLYNNTDDVLTFEVNGEVFYPEPGSANFTGSKSCSPGHVPIEAFCSPCPGGTRQAGGECVLCGRGSYQDVPAQTSCKACPPWSSTPRPGATSRQQCRVHCPAGRRQVGELCEECDTDSYQDREGQSSCKPCPPGRSTPYPAATALSQCSGCRTFHFAWWTVLLGVFCAL